MPITVKDALGLADFDLAVVAVLEGCNVGCPSLMVGLFAKPLAVAEPANAERDAALRLVRGVALLDADTDGIDDDATGAGTAAVTSGCGHRATTSPETRTPLSATGPATRANRTTRRGFSARRGRGRAKLVLPRVARPKRYLSRGV